MTIWTSMITLVGHCRVTGSRRRMVFPRVEAASALAGSALRSSNVSGKARLMMPFPVKCMTACERAGASGRAPLRLLVMQQIEAVLLHRHEARRGDHRAVARPRQVDRQRLHDPSG